MVADVFSPPPPRPVHVLAAPSEGWHEPFAQATKGVARLVGLFAHVCAHARVREGKVAESVCVCAFWSFRIGNPTPVLLYRLL